ncbi:DsbA family protein [Maridesulfovibrio zosterae]|uniref:DsbA family protein n=1 Tax=Maridesulfovibrio zosterae TaxID=82171 RepID=UPI0004837726|nr:thioredoxin domain-containing protein [Maridesulfovibrio zosterae]
MKSLFLPLILVFCIFLVPSVSYSASFSKSEIKNEIRKTLKEEPQLIFEALKGHEEELYDLIQIGLEKKNKAKIRDRRLKQLTNPKLARKYPKRPIWGSANSKISIIAFSDFQSATCSKADKTIIELLKKHPEINYRFRHNPLGIHKMSRPAAMYYEAAAIQNHEQAKTLNHLILKNRLKIKKNGTKELDKLAIAANLNIKKLHQDLNLPEIAKKVDQDIAEAKQLGFTASPVYLVNGVTVTGARTLEEFEEVLEMINSQTP